MISLYKKYMGWMDYLASSTSRTLSEDAVF